MNSDACGYPLSHLYLRLLSEFLCAERFTLAAAKLYSAAVWGTRDAFSQKNSRPQLAAPRPNAGPGRLRRHRDL